MLSSSIKRYLGFLLFLTLLVIGIRTYKTYGVSWDEREQRTIGMVSYNYLTHGDNTLRHYSNNVYGVGVELPLVLVEKVLGMNDMRSIFWMRHLLTHLLFLFGALAFFLLIDDLYKNKLLATIGFLMLVAMPLIYTHSFYNTKDVPFLSVYIICYWLCYRAFRKNTLGAYLLLGIACGYLTNIRIMGILLIGCICLFFLTDYLLSKPNLVKRRQIRKSFWIFLGAAFLTLYITWPFLYNNPFQNFADAFKNMSKHGWEGVLLFNGQNIKSTAIPWNYAIIWFCISTPLVFLLAGLTGIIILAWRFVHKPLFFLTDIKARNQSLFAIGFFQPLVSVIIFHSVIFDAWRHLYFIYPSFVLLAIYALDILFKTSLKWGYVLVMLGGIAMSAGFMFSNYPYENIYFNALAGSQQQEGLRKRWELDYWGNSFKQVLEHIAKSDTSKNIEIAVSQPSVLFNICMLDPKDSIRFKHVGYTEKAEKAAYFITGYRNHPDDYPFQGKAVYSIEVENSSIATIFKAKR
jgi:hypothetical protein